MMSLSVGTLQWPGDLGGDLLVFVVGEQRQPQRQIRGHMCGQLAVRAGVTDPADRDHLIDRIPWRAALL